jgi:hypothetical protein
MKCEICKTIAKLGLDQSAHDLWMCSDAQEHPASAKGVRAYVEHIRRQITVFWILKKRQHRAWTMTHHQRLVTLGL